MMSKIRLLLRPAVYPLLLGLLLLLTGLNLAAGTSVEDPQALFHEGKRLIEENCGDCMGGTRTGLELGIKKIEDALEVGVDDPTRAYRLLAEAYGDLALVYAEPDSTERQEAIKIQQSYYRRLVQLHPKDVEALYELAGMVQDNSERVALLRRILELDPNHLQARFTLGQELVDQGSKEGLELMRAVFEQALAEGEDERLIWFYGSRLEWVLRERSLDDEADDVAQRRDECLETIRAGYQQH